MRKFLSLLAAILMVGSMMAGTVFFVNDKGWTAPKCYAWSPANAAWPGEAMTKEAYQLQGYDVYSYTAAEGVTYGNCIFNNGNGAQTADQTWTDDHYFFQNKWYTRAELEGDTIEAPAVVLDTIYYVNTSDWASVNCYAWSPANASWPGEAMTEVAGMDVQGHNVWMYAHEALPNCIFNDGNSQTGNLTWTSGKYFMTDAWYTYDELMALEGDTTTTQPTDTTTTQPTDSTIVGPTPVTYYMKHAWEGTTDWSWKALEDSTIMYMGLPLHGYYVNNNWYGAGVDVNTEMSDSGAKWYPSSSIQFITTDPETEQYVAAEEPAVGTWATFLYSTFPKDTVLVWYETIPADTTTTQPTDTTTTQPTDSTVTAIEYTIVGASGLLGSSWSLTAAENLMTLQADGTYQLVKTELTLSAGSYEYKVVADHSWEGWQIPESGNQSLTITESGIYMVTFTLDVKANTLTAVAELQQSVDVKPVVSLAGPFNGWSTTATVLTEGADGLTASVVLTLDTADVEFKVVKDGNWLSTGAAITREANSAVITGNVTANMTLKTDVAGDYTFTWTYATNMLEVAFPALAEDTTTTQPTDTTTTQPTDSTIVDPDMPTEGFGILVYGEEKNHGIVGVLNEGQTEFTEYAVTGVEFVAGDQFQIYDFTNKAGWVEPLDAASTAHVSLGEYWYVADTAGTYDIYIKMYGPGDNEVFVGFVVPTDTTTTQPTDTTTTQPTDTTIVTPTGTTLYVIGSVNDWTQADADYKMTEVVAGSQWTFDFGTMNLAGQQFKINDGSWTGEYNIGKADEADEGLKEGTIVVVNDGGSANINLDTQYNGATNVVITLNKDAEGNFTLTATGNFTTGEAIIPDLYLRGGDDAAWSASEAHKFTREGSNMKWTLTLDVDPAVFGAFKIADANWGDYNFGATEEALQIGVAYVLANGGQSNITLPAGIAAGNYTFTLTNEDGVWMLTVVCNGDLNPTDLELLMMSGKAVKTIENGHVVIIKNGVRYNMFGM